MKAVSTIHNAQLTRVDPIETVLLIICPTALLLLNYSGNPLALWNGCITQLPLSKF